MHINEHVHVHRGPSNWYTKWTELASEMGKKGGNHDAIQSERIFVDP